MVIVLPLLIHSDVKIYSRLASYSNLLHNLSSVSDTLVDANFDQKRIGDYSLTIPVTAVS